MILTQEALAAAPLLTLVATGDHKTAAALAVALGRDDANTRKSLKAHHAAGWLDKGALTLTEAGREILDALQRANNPAASSGDGEGLREIALELIDDDPELNPRKRKLGEIAVKADEAKLAELTASIREKGVLQPILVRQGLTPGRFRTVAGSRRRLAALNAGVAVIPALYKVMTDAQAHEAATIENVQRDDMAPMEEAHAFTRIVRDRMAVDPDLSLKDAKEIVAGVLKKTVRFVELRMQLLQLPAAMQDKVEAEELSVTEARKWLQSRPKPLNLTPRQWLIALELFDAQERRPAGAGFAGAATLVTADAQDDGDLAALMGSPAGLISDVREIRDDDGVRTGLFALRFFEHRLDALRLKFGAVDHDDTRAAALVDARAAVFGPIKGDPRMHFVAPDAYATEWLNGPFEPSAAGLAEIEQERAAARARAETSQREQAQAQAQHDAAVAEGLARLTAVLNLGERLDRKPPPALDPLFAGVFAATGKPLPVYPTRLGGIIAANGAQLFHDFPEHSPPSPDLIARVTLFAMALNAVAGLATPQAAPAQAEDGEITLDLGETDEDEAAIEDDEDREEEAAGPVLLGIDGGALEDVAAEFSPALLKLAGVATPPCPHP